jgi:leucyl aminopeptidase
MLVTADSRNPAEIETDLLVVPLAQLGDEKRRLPSRVAALDRALGGRISSVLEGGDFRGKREQRLLLYPDAALPAKRLLLLGLGEEAKLEADALRSAAGTAVKEAATRRAAKLTVVVPVLRRVRAPAASQALAEGAVLGA